MAFQIIRDDITRVAVDVIVNSANPQPKIGGGVDGAIYRAAGADELLADRRKIGPIAAGEVYETKAYALPAKYIFHTVGPIWQGGGCGEEKLLRQCYERCLERAKELGCESIAFPLISGGIFGYPKEEAIMVAVSVFRDSPAAEDLRIIFVMYDREAFHLSDGLFAGVDSYINDRYVEIHTPRERERQRSQFAMLRRKKTESGPAFMSLSAAKEACEEAPAEAAEECDLSENAAADVLPEFAGKENAAYANMAFAGAKPMSAETAGAMCTDADAMMSADADVMMSSVQFEARKEKKRSLDELVAEVGESWQKSLLRMIDEKGYTDTEVYKRANLDRKIFSKIRSNENYRPKKPTAIALALALRLSLDETDDMLARAVYALSPSSRADLIVRYFIENEVYDTYTINLALFEHGQPILGE